MEFPNPSIQEGRAGIKYDVIYRPFFHKNEINSVMVLTYRDETIHMTGWYYQRMDAHGISALGPFPTPKDAFEHAHVKLAIKEETPEMALPKNYADFVAQLVKPGSEMLASLTPEKVDLIHMVLGVVGEAGELVDAIKKHVAYNRPLDMANVIEELGDLEFYLQGIRNNLKIGRGEVLSGNMKKLAKRYAGLTYSDKAAHERADKKEGETP